MNGITECRYLYFCDWWCPLSSNFLLSSLSCSVRNALVVVAASFIAFSWNAYGHPVFTVTGETSQGLPPFRPPPTSDTTANGTVVSFGEIVEVRSRETRPTRGWGRWIFLIHDWVATFTSQNLSSSQEEQLTSQAFSVCVFCAGLWRRACCDSLHGSVGEHCYC